MIKKLLATLTACVAGMSMCVFAACADEPTEEGTATLPSENQEGATPRPDETPDLTYIDMSGMTEEEAVAQYGYYVIDKDGSNSYSNGDEVHFGSYPQSLVVDGETLSLLAEKEGVVPGGEEQTDWTSYGYYDGGEIADYMWYKDVEADGQTFRGVYMTAYRGTDYKQSATQTAGGQHGATQELGVVCWYKWEPIKWTVISYSENTAYLICLDVLDCQPFQDVYTGDKTAGYTTAAGGNINDWSCSSLRTFLNGTFYNLAFNGKEQALVVETELDNAGSCHKKYGKELAATTDKIFLPAYMDLVNAEYGFTDTTSFHLQSSVGEENLNNPGIEVVAQAMARRRGGTDYGLAQGANYSTTCISSTGHYAAMYGLRSAGDTNCVSSVNKYGDITATGELYAYTVSGVVPALCINIGK